MRSPFRNTQVPLRVPLLITITISESEQMNSIEVKNLKLNGESKEMFGLGSQVCDNQIDVLVSNPPYILRKDLSQLDPQITL